MGKVNGIPDTKTGGPLEPPAAGYHLNGMKIDTQQDAVGPINIFSSIPLSRTAISFFSFFSSMRPPSFCENKLMLGIQWLYCEILAGFATLKRYIVRLENLDLLSKKFALPEGKERGRESRYGLLGFSAEVLEEQLTIMMDNIFK